MFKIAEVTDRASMSLDDRRSNSGERCAYDFGAGFNALARFHSLPVDYVKLGAAMIQQSDPLRAEALCRSVLTICDYLGATVVAEGIETQEQAQMLIRLGCDIGQGCLYGRARPLHMLSTFP